MCLGLPGRIVEVQPGGDVARVDVAGVLREINIALLDGPFVPGDYLLIHSGFAVERMSPDEARDALDVFAEGPSSVEGAPAEGTAAEGAAP
jgi:hydrogenase expression/formation protein HypC